MTDRFMTRMAVFVILRNEAGEILLEQRANTGYLDGYWDLPSGHVEYAESIHQTAVREVLEEGVVNEAKSDPADTPCPTYALEDETREGQHLRIVFARCNDAVKVVTCIDLDQEFTCHCE